MAKSEGTLRFPVSTNTVEIVDGLNAITAALGSHLGMRFQLPCPGAGSDGSRRLSCAEMSRVSRMVEAVAQAIELLREERPAEALAALEDLQREPTSGVEEPTS